MRIPRFKSATDGILYALEFATPEGKAGNFRDDYPKFYVDAKEGEREISFITACLAANRYDVNKIRCLYRSVYNPDWKDFIWFYIKPDNVTVLYDGLGSPIKPSVRDNTLVRGSRF